MPSGPSDSQRRPRKYRNEPVVVDGIRFDSGREARRYQELLLLQKAGQIEDLETQPVYILAPSVKFDGERRAKPALRYKADFRYRELPAGNTVVEDVKSVATMTQPYRIRRHLMLSVHGIQVREILR